MSEPRDARLEQLIRDDADDDGNLTVYGDWLAAQGSPRGELVALQAKGLPGQAAALLAKHPELGLANLEEVGWRLGFIDKAKLRSRHNQPLAVAVLGELLDGPGRFIRELTIGLVDLRTNNYAPITALLAQRRVPTLRSLYYGDFGYEETELNWSTIGDISALGAALPNLRHLKLRSGGMKLGALAFPELRSFTTITGQLDAPSAQAIGTATWPKLEKLDLMVGGQGSPRVRMADLQPILDGDGLPALRWLGIKNFTFHGELVPALLASKLVAQLTTLDLSMGTLADREAAVLGAAKDKLGHLERLIIGENYLTATGFEALAQLGIAIVSTESGLKSHGADTDERGQRELEDLDPDDPEDEGSRYAAVYE